MTKEYTHQVLLYYHYVDIEDPETFAEEHLAFCNELELKGRVLVANEGINGTVSGTIEQTQRYMEEMHNNPMFRDMVFKIDAHDGHAFKKMEEESNVILDARNDSEYDVGHFRGAIRPDIRTFRDLPQWVRENKDLLEGKKVLTYCTGGIRCEKFSGWLAREGFEDVGQL